MPKLDRRMQPKSSSSQLLKNQQTNILHHQRGAARSVKIKGDVSFSSTNCLFRLFFFLNLSVIKSARFFETFYLTPFQIAENWNRHCNSDKKFAFSPPTFANISWLIGSETNSWNVGLWQFVQDFDLETLRATGEWIWRGLRAKLPRIFGYN